MNVLAAVVTHHGWTYEWYKWAPATMLALLGILAVSWKVLRVMARVDNALPTLLSIAEEFKPNGGSSLKDQINQIQAEGRERAALMEQHTQQDEVRFARLEGILLAQGQTQPTPPRRSRSKSNPKSSTPA